MKDRISVDQRFAVLAKLGENINWDLLTTEQVQVGVLESERAGTEATAFIQNGFRVQVSDFFRETGELTIQISALARPTLGQLREKYSWIKEEGGIERDTSPTEAITIKLGTVLRPDEERVNGAEYEKRIAPKLNLGLGYQHALWLVEHQEEFPEFMALLGKVYIDFPGLVVVDADGNRSFPFLLENGGRWSLRWRWIVDGLDRGGRLALSGK
ncbi:MAG TPA: hypothetical protein VMV71_02990 [Candidatus Paceibacterota bacterium]|nr:hypothetical protein [Candidatus Paceibacterota bacterium]